jgi:hypothetical protein
MVRQIAAWNMVKQIEIEDHIEGGIGQRLQNQTRHQSRGGIGGQQADAARLCDQRQAHGDAPADPGQHRRQHQNCHQSGKGHIEIDKTDGFGRTKNLIGLQRYKRQQERA